MKMIVAMILGHIRLIVILLVLVFAGIVMGEKSLTQKQGLERKKALIEKKNEELISEIKTVERRITLLRTDPRTIEKAAKRRLGMARPGETVYIFNERN